MLSAKLEGSEKCIFGRVSPGLSTGQQEAGIYCKSKGILKLEKSGISDFEGASVSQGREDVW